MRAWILLAGAAALVAGGVRAAETPADLVVTHARIFTQDPARSQREAMAVRGGRIVYVGDDQGARAFAGQGTRVDDLHGRVVLPGLVDSHIHPTEIVQLDVCDLRSEAKTLAQM